MLHGAAEMGRSQKRKPKKPAIKPMTPAQATRHIREKLKSGHVDLDFTSHVKTRLEQRGLIMSDVLHVLKHGTVYEEAEPTTRDSFFKYKIECTTPNSGGRSIRLVVIPSPSSYIKVVTIMWVDGT